MFLEYFETFIDRFENTQCMPALKLSEKIPAFLLLFYSVQSFAWL